MYTLERLFLLFSCTAIVNLRLSLLVYLYRRVACSYIELELNWRREPRERGELLEVGTKASPTEVNTVIFDAGTVKAGN